MVAFAFFVPPVLAALMASALAKSKVNALILSVIIALLAVLVTYGLLRLKFGPLDLGVFMPITQGMSFFSALLIALLVIDTQRERPH